MHMTWLTNIPTPYTVPVWDALGKMVDLKVLCLARTEPGRHWDEARGPVDIQYVDAKKVHVGRHAVYGLSRNLSRSLKPTPDVIVIDGWQAPAYLQAFYTAKRRGSRIVLSYWSTPDTHAMS